MEPPKEEPREVKFEPDDGPTEGVITIKFDPNSKGKSSATGKSRILSTSNGYQEIARWPGVFLSFNIIRKR